MSSDVMFAVPSLKPNMLRGVTCACEVDDVRPKPSWLQRTATTPKPIRTRLRTACTATCGSSEQAWMTMSPPERAGSRSSPSEAGQLAQRLGPAVGQAEPVVEQARAVADRHGEVTGREVERLPGVLRHVPRPPADDAARRRLGAERHPLGGGGPPGQQVAQRVAVVGDDVERDEVQPVLGRRGDAGLPLTAEGHDAVVHGIRLRRARGAGRPGGVGQPGGRGGQGGTRAGGEDRPAGGAGHFPATSPATVATGSENASSASVSALRSAGVSAV